MNATTKQATNALMRTVLAGVMAAHIGVPGATTDALLYESIPSSDYHADINSTSCSQLKAFLESPAHFQLGLTEEHQPTVSMELGTLVHLLALQPELFSNEYVIFPGARDKRDKDFTSFVEANQDRTVATHQEFTTALYMVERLRGACYKGRPIGRFIDEAKKEVSIFANEPVTGLRLRIRPDILHPDLTFDLKTTRQPNFDAFRADAIAMHYDMQAFMYIVCRAIFEGDNKGKPFVFLGVESNAPHSVYVATAGDSVRENGAKKLKHCLTQLKACRDVNYWPDNSCEGTFEIQPWQQFAR